MNDAFEMYAMQQEQIRRGVETLLSVMRTFSTAKEMDILTTSDRAIIKNKTMMLIGKLDHYRVDDGQVIPKINI